MSVERTILLVDNDPTVLTALRARIGAMGHRCVTAGTGAQALAAFAAAEPDLVVSDLHMPQGDGIALAEAIRRRSAVPIILISGFKDAYRRQLRHIRDVTFLHKPFDTATLVELIRAALGSTGSESGAAERPAA